LFASKLETPSITVRFVTCRLASIVSTSHSTGLFPMRERVHNAASNPQQPH
jgi:hypothetical protein